MASLNVRRGIFQGKVRVLEKLLAKKRLDFAREGAAARIAHAWRVHAFRQRCKYGLQRTVNDKATVIQRVYRGFRGRKQANILRSQLQRLALHGQRVWRARAARRRLLELREERIRHWAAARMQAVFRGKRQRAIMRLWGSRRWMAAAAMQTAWRLFVARRRKLEAEEEQLTDWMLRLLDLGYSRDPKAPPMPMRAAHRLALLERLKPEPEAQQADGEQADSAVTALAHKRVVSSAAAVKLQQAAVKAVPAGVYDSRKAQRAKTTTTKVWSLASRSRRKQKASRDPAGRAAMLIRNGALADAGQGALQGGVYMGPSPKPPKPRVLVHIPAGRHGEAEEEAARLQAQIEAGYGDDDADLAGDDDDEEDGEAAASSAAAGQQSGRATDGKGGRRFRGFAAALTTARGGRASARDDYDDPDRFARPDLNPLEAPPGTRFNRKDRFGQPSIAEVLDDMRRISDALQWHRERTAREERRRAAYALRSAESKAQRAAVRARMLALRGEGVVETMRRLRSFVAGVSDVQGELRERRQALRTHVEEQEQRVRRGRAALRRFDRAARDSLRRAGGLLDATELEALLALLPSPQQMRAATAVSRGQVGDWERDAPERRMTRRQRRLSTQGPAERAAALLVPIPGRTVTPTARSSVQDESAALAPRQNAADRGIPQQRASQRPGAKAEVAPGGFEGLFAGPDARVSTPQALPDSARPFEDEKSSSSSSAATNTMPHDSSSSSSRSAAGREKTPLRRAAPVPALVASNSVGSRASGFAAAFLGTPPGRFKPGMEQLADRVAVRRPPTAPTTADAAHNTADQNSQADVEQQADQTGAEDAAQLPSPARAVSPARSILVTSQQRPRSPAGSVSFAVEEGNE